jgi:hypothetical protein
VGTIRNLSDLLTNRPSEIDNLDSQTLPPNESNS